MSLATRSREAIPRFEHGAPPESPCETVGSNSTADPTELATDTKFIWPSSVGYFEDIVMDEDTCIEFHGLSNIWSLCLGIAGLLDLVACLFPSFVGSFAEHDDEDPFASEKYTFPGWFLSSAAFLDRHGVTISFCFSALWFADAFVTAQNRRKTFMMKEEKSAMLSAGKPPEKVPKDKWYKMALFVYYRTMLLQLLLLPVGFYYLLSYAVNHVATGRIVDNLDTVDESVTLEVESVDHDIEIERFSAKSKISLLFAILQHLLLKISGSTMRHLRLKYGEFMRRARPAAIKRLLSRAIRNPWKFRRNLQKLLTAVRWIKYAAPLIGIFNKLKANVSDMLKMRRQRRIAEKQKRIRQLLWDTKPNQVRELEAAKKIQSAFRAYRIRKTTNALLALKGDRYYVAAIKVQRGFRAALARARQRLRKKKQEFRRLSAVKLTEVSELGAEDMRRFYHLQDELAAEADKLINKRLLLRPNTRFSVIWKFLFVMCITMEISQLLAKPWLDSYRSQRKGEPMTMSEFVALSFTPLRASQRPECMIPIKRFRYFNIGAFKRNRTRDTDFGRALPWYCVPPGSIVQEGYSDVVSLLLAPAPVGEWPDCRDEDGRPWQKRRSKPRRWYCREPYQSIHVAYRKILDFMLEEFLVVVSIVCFLDVFVTFFTGEFDDLTGELVPKPFVVRWIAPGLVLQLLVNPRLGVLAKIVGEVGRTVLKYGPVRVLRWSVSTIFPVAYFAWSYFIRFVWMPLVDYENVSETTVDLC